LRNLAKRPSTPSINPATNNKITAKLNSKAIENLIAVKVKHKLEIVTKFGNNENKVRLRASLLNSLFLE
jgi:hypothetical protein